MLPFRNGITSDNPVSDAIDLESLHTWYFAALLIGSNFFGFPLILYGHKHYFFLITVATLVAVVFSLAYHTCQTCSICFGFSLATLTLADHVSAPAFMMMLIFFIINTRSTRHIKSQLRERAHEYSLDSVTVATPPLPPPLPTKEPFAQRIDRFWETYSPSSSSSPPARMHRTREKKQSRPIIPSPSPSPPALVQTYRVQPVNRLPLSTGTSASSSWHDSSYERATERREAQLYDEDLTRTYYAVGYSHMEQNDLGNAWGVYIPYISIFIVFIAALAHPFSMQAFVIAIVFGLCAVFFKIVVIDEGDPVDMYHRLSLPDFTLGIVLMVASLVFYMLDVYWEYGITHALWHVFSFLGAYFLVIGLSRHVDNWYSPLRSFYYWSLVCCIKERHL